MPVITEDKLTPNDFMREIEEINRRLGKIQDSLEELKELKESVTHLDSINDHLESIYFLIKEKNK